MTRGDLLDLTGRKCLGASHVTFVPEGRSVDDVWAETRRFGQLVDFTEGTPGSWAVIECDGDGDDPCDCRSTLLAENFTWHHNDVCFYAADGTGLMQRAGLLATGSTEAEA